MKHPTTELLLAIVRGDRAAAEAVAARAPADPARFVERCRESDVHPWVHALLVRPEQAGLVAPEALERLSKLRAKVRADNLLLLARAEQAIDLLRGAGVTPVALKGLDLLHRLYGRFDERTLDDVDLLVARHELRPALAALEEAGWAVPPEPARSGYVRNSHHLPLASPGPVPVHFELHWNIVQDDRYRVDAAGLIERARPLEVSGRKLLRLDDHDLVAHLLVHHFSHYFDRRLKWVVDLQKLVAVPGFRWDAVVERIRAWDAVTAAGISLRHLRKLDPEHIPVEVLRDLPVAGWRLALGWPLRSDHPLELYRATRKRSVQLYLAAILLEHPARLPGWIVHRRTRGRRATDHPLESPERHPHGKESPCNR